ncbi:hypothetical protein D3C71_1335800 [compost metagenome]
MIEHLVNGFRTKLVAVDGAAAIKALQLPRVVGGMYGAGQIDILADLGECIGGEAGGDRAGLDQAHLDAAAGQFHAQGQRQSFERIFRGRVSPAITIRQKAEDGGAVYDAAAPLSPHEGNDLAGQFVPAEEIGLELDAQHIRRQILHRSRLAVGAIVEQRVDPAIGAFDHGFYQLIDRILLRVIEDQRLYAVSFKGSEIFAVSNRCEDAPAVCLQCPCRISADAGGTAGDDDRSCCSHSGILPRHSPVQVRMFLPYFALSHNGADLAGRNTPAAMAPIGLQGPVGCLLAFHGG